MNLELIGSVALPVVVGSVSGFVHSIHREETKSWYNALRKPSFNPPSWLFPPVWTGLYMSMGYAAYLVGKEGGWERQAVPLALYGTQLALNVAWSPLFFGAKKLGAALVDIGLLDVAVAATAYSFYGVNETAGLLMVPYLAWISFATLLNYQIWDMNTAKSKPE